MNIYEIASKNHTKAELIAMVERANGLAIDAEENFQHTKNALNALRIEKNLEADANKTRTSQTDPVTDFLNLITTDETLYRDREFVITDTCQFDRRVIVEAIIDKLYWLKTSRKGHDAYAISTKERAEYAMRRNDGTEIALTQLKAAVSEARAAQSKLALFDRMQDQLRGYYAETFGKSYIAYGENEANVPSNQQPQAIPADIAADMAALGITPPADQTANTNGVETTANVA